MKRLRDVLRGRVRHVARTPPHAPARFQVQNIQSLVATFLPDVIELLPASQVIRRSTIRLTDLDRIDDFPERSTVRAEYSDKRIRWPPVLHLTLDDAYVFGHGTVIWRDHIIRETLSPVVANAPHLFPEGREQEDGSWIVDIGRTTEYPGSAFLASRHRLATYGHWIGEILPRIDLASRAGLLEGRTLLFPASLRPAGAESSSPTRRSVSAYADMLQDSLDAIDASRNEVVSIPRGGLRVARLGLVSPMGDVRAKRPEIHQTYQRIADRFGSSSDRSRLYLTREGVGSRDIANESDVHDFLAARGFFTVRPERMSFGDQVQLFKSAEMICGPLGSAFANIVFASPDCRVLALVPEQWSDTFFYDLAATRGMQWYEVRGPVVAETTGPHHRKDFEVDVDRLATAFTRATQQTGAS